MVLKILLVSKNLIYRTPLKINEMRKNKKYLYLGYIIPAIFWITLIICGLMTENYNHFVNTVSELGRIGTETQYIFTIGLVICSILSILFCIGLYKTAKDLKLNPSPILLILTFSFSILGAAVFPLPLGLHGILGSPSMFLPLSPLFALILWDNASIQNIKIGSGLILALMILGFLTFIPNFMDNYFGLKQRFFHFAWTFWFVFLSYKFLRL